MVTALHRVPTEHRLHAGYPTSPEGGPRYPRPVRAVGCAVWTAHSCWLLLLCALVSQRGSKRRAKSPSFDEDDMASSDIDATPAPTVRARKRARRALPATLAADAGETDEEEDDYEALRDGFSAVAASSARTFRAGSKSKAKSVRRRRR